MKIILYDKRTILIDIICIIGNIICIFLINTNLYASMTIFMILNLFDILAKRFAKKTRE